MLGSNKKESGTMTLQMIGNAKAAETVLQETDSCGQDTNASANNTTIRNHRVGTITTGIAMIVYGSLFLLQTFTKSIRYETIFKLWPCILIGLGIEVLASNFETKKLTYDKGAIVLLFALTFFAMCMAGAQLGFAYIK